MKILLAEDDRMTRSMLSMALRRWGYEVLPAEDGEQAWEFLLRDDVSFVISDWNMPRLNGVELCQRIRAANLPRYVYTILCTANTQKSDLVAGMDAGADDFLGKPVDMAELRVRVHAGERVLDLEARLAEWNRKLLAKNQELERAYQRIDKDLRAAAWMQENLLPRAATSIHGVRFESLFLPCSYVAGDIFNFFELDGRHVGFYLLDVSGHGVPSAVLSMTLSKVLLPEPAPGSPLRRRSASGEGYEIADPAEVARTLNQRFQSGDDMYFTMVYGVLDAATGRLRFTQAGQPHPLWCRAGGEVRPVGEGGFPIGMVPEMDYETHAVQLEPGDRLVLYSDGVTECLSPDGRLFQERRLVGALQEAAALPMAAGFERLAGELERWQDKSEFEDDVSLLALQWDGPPRANAD